MPKKYLINVIAIYWGRNDRYRVMAEYRVMAATRYLCVGEIEWLKELAILICCGDGKHKN